MIYRVCFEFDIEEDCMEAAIGRAEGFVFDANESLCWRNGLIRDVDELPEKVLA